MRNNLVWVTLPWVIVILLAILAFILLIIGPTDYSRWDSYRQNCAEAGGHIYMPVTTAWCLSKDGKIIEVYP